MAVEKSIQRDNGSRRTKSAALLSVSNLRKNYGPVVALDGVDLELYEREVVALVGDNGAGKSTLVKCLSGAVLPSGGLVRIDGQVRSDFSVQAFRSAGIEVVHQHLSLIDVLTVVENFFLGRELTKGGFLGQFFGLLDRQRMARETGAALNRLGVQIDNIRRPVRNLSGGQRQIIAVAKAVNWGGKVVLMDEPSAALGVEQTEKVLEFARTLANAGVSVVLVTHNMHQVDQVADRVVVLRHGKKIADVQAHETSTDQIVGWITGGLELRN